MLDIVENSSNGFNVIRGGMSYKHNDLRDMSLYRAYAQFERIPVFANEPVFDTMENLTEYSAVFNKAVGRVLNMRPISKSYNLVSHQSAFDEQAKQIEHSHFDDRRLEVVDRLYEDGKKAHRTVYFIDHKHDINSRSIDDAVVPRIDIYNSVDMSWAFQIFSGAYRDLCRNSLVFGGQKAYHQKRKHTRGLDVPAMIGKSVLSLEMFDAQRDLMNNWARTRLDAESFAHILRNTLCKKPEKKSADYVRPESRPVNEKLLEYLLEQFFEESKELGETVWAGYNALTHWSTHTIEARGKENQKQHDIRRKRQDEVRDVITSPDWLSLCEVA